MSARARTRPVTAMVSSDSRRSSRPQRQGMAVYEPSSGTAVPGAGAPSGTRSSGGGTRASAWMSRAPFPTRPGNAGSRPTTCVKSQVRPAISTAGASSASAETGATPWRTNPLAARRIASSAPRERPHRYTRRAPRSERSASCAASSMSERVTVSRSPGEVPWPGSSGPTARNPARASASPTGRTSAGEPVSPCSSRQASSPSPRLNGAAGPDMREGAVPRPRGSRKWTC